MTFLAVFQFIFASSIFNDAPHFSQYGIQTSGSPVLTAMLSFHHYLMVVLIVIGTSVFYFLWYIFTNFSNDKTQAGNTVAKFSHSNDLEISWTILPAVILLFLAIPSFSLLYSLDESINPALTLKVVGHQWYWSYEYSGFVFGENQYNLEFDSYMVNDADLRRGMFRCLEVDNRVHIPSKTHIRVIVTSSDVLHSWAVPSLGIKIDACPGRLSQISLYAQRNSTYFGQCSEICGINHGFMPIVVTAESKKKFFRWLSWNCNR